ncbi:MAG: endonuclease [Pseudonocardiales bacterium]|nr:endonuclease [Pseudonocardiales bacterium]
MLLDQMLDTATEAPRYDVWQSVIEPVPPSAETVASRELGEQIVALAGRLAAGTCRWLLMVANFEAGEGFHAFGLPSTAAWLSYSCGLSKRTAMDHVRVGRYLAAYPELATEMSAGRLSYSQVRALTRALSLPTADDAQPGPALPEAAPAGAVAGPSLALVASGSSRWPLTDPEAPLAYLASLENNDYANGLIGIARNGTVAQLESVVRGLRTVETNEAANAGIPLPERVGIGWNSDGTWRLSARLHPERGAVVDSALNRIAEAEGLNRADAFVRLAEIALAALNDAEPRTLLGEERAAVVIHIDAARIPQPSTLTNRERSAERSDPPAARLGDGPGLPDSVALRLACDGRIRTVATDRDTEDRVRILDVGRSHRLATKRQKRALMLRQGGRCGHPGCANTRGLEAHHVIHWLHGGLTDLDNLVLLCPRHHHGHHEGRFVITSLDGGQFAFTLRDGTPLPDTVNAGPLIAGLQPVENEHADVEDRAPTTEWRGERLNRPYAVGVLAQQRPPAA